MGASSVTGVSGPGDSRGKQKQDNHSGCPCSSKADENPPSEPVKRGCVVEYKTGNKKSYNAGKGVARTKVC